MGFASGCSGGAVGSSLVRGSDGSAVYADFFFFFFFHS